MYAHEIMIKEAKERGFQKGLQEGRQKGVEIVAIKLWQHNYSTTWISNSLDLPIERIEFLIAEFKKKSKD